MINQNKIRIHKKSVLDKPDYELLIDDYVIGGVTVGENYESALGLPNYYVISKQRDSLREIAALTLNEFRLARVESIHLENWTRWEGFEISVIFRPEFKSRKGIMFEVEFEPDLVNWNFPYSYNDYYKRFRHVWETEIDNDPLFGIGGKKDKFMPVVEAVLNNLSIAEEVEKNLEPFVEIHKITLDQLEQEQFKNSLLTSFSFPEELKVPCEQYLLYFAQFLKDLGINATPNLKEEAGRVLFSVTPTEDIEALDKIREALAVYLNLPSSPIVYDESLKSMRLKQQIDNLQHSQKMAEMEFRLAHKVIESQDKIIEEKNVTIEQQSKIIEKIISKSIMIDSAENKEELEELFEGVKVGKSKFLAEQLGLHLNPATALKSVGKKLIGKEGITSLNLDDDVKNN